MGEAGRPFVCDPGDVRVGAAGPGHTGPLGARHRF